MKNLVRNLLDDVLITKNLKIEANHQTLAVFKVRHYYIYFKNSFSNREFHTFKISFDVFFFAVEYSINYL